MADELVIKISGDIASYSKAIDEVQKKTDDLNSALATAAKVAGVAFAALTAEVGFSVHAYAESEAASRSLSQAMQNQGLFSSKLIQSYKDQAAAIQQQTGIDDDSIIKGQARLQGMIGQRVVTQDLTKAAVELGQQAGSVEAGFEILGRALAGNTRGLKQFNIAIDENLPYAERQKQILEKVTVAFAGQAEAANQGLGSLKGLKSAFSDIQEDIGQQFTPAITAVIKGLTEMFTIVKQHPEITKFAAAVLAAGVAVTGLATAAAIGGIAFLSLSAAMQAANVTISLTTLGLRTLVGATGLGLFILIVTEAYLHWNEVWPRMKAVFDGFVISVTGSLKGLGEVLNGVFHFDLAKIEEGLSKVKASLVAGVAEMKKDIPPIEIGADQDPAKKGAADKAFSEQRAQEQREIAARRAHQALLVLESGKFSDQELEIKKQQAELLSQIADENNKNIRAQLQEKYDETLFQQQELSAREISEQKILNDELLSTNEQYRNLEDDQKAEFNEKRKAKVLAEIDNEKQARQKAFDESLKTQVERHNKFILEEQKYGKAYATINQVIYSDQVQGVKSAATEMIQFQQSSNETLKSIGKAAAVADIIIKTATSAMNIYNGFATIPIIGPALGVAGAAAAVAFGAEQIGKVTSAADGGELTGGIPGRDSIHMLGMPGELVTPERNFDEVVNAVADERNAQRSVGVGSDNVSGGIAHLVLEMKGSLMDYIDVQLVQRQQLGISIQRG